MARLDGKVAIITGAASGIGLAGARLFAADGAKVVLADVSGEALDNAAQSVRAAGGDALAVLLDVTEPASWAEATRRTLSEYGQINVLVNNAGVHVRKGVLETELDDWNRVMQVNVTGVWLGMKAVIPHMQASGGGSIVNISSVAGIVGGMADGGSAAYSASKGAVRSLTKHAAQNFAVDGIRVNSIHPGPVVSGLTAAAGFTRESMAERYADEIPLPPHVGEGSDIGYGMLYLASDESKFVTGEELVIDGGWTTH